MGRELLFVRDLDGNGRVVAESLLSALDWIENESGTEVELEKEPGGGGDIDSIDAGEGIVCGMVVRVVWLFNFREGVRDRLPSCLVRSWVRELEVSVVKGGGGFEGVMGFVRGEKVEVAVHIKKVFGRIVPGQLGIIKELCLDPQYLCECQPMVVNVPV